MLYPEEIMNTAADAIFGEEGRMAAILSPVTLAEREFIHWIENRKSKETAGTGLRSGDPQPATKKETV